MKNRILKDIKAYEQRFIENSNIDDINFYAGNTEEEKIKNCIENEFKSLITMYKQNNKSFDAVMKQAFLGGPTFRKRKLTIRKYAQIAENLFKDKYQNLSIGIEFAKYACEAFYAPYETIDSEEFIIEAAAIFTLDELFNHDLEKEAFKYMPKDEESLSTAVVHPEASDCLYADELIQSLCYLFQNQTKQNKNELAFLLTEDLAQQEEFGAKKYNNPTTNKEKLLTILSLIPKKTIERVIKNFENDLWRFFDVILNLENELQKDLIKERELTKVNLRKIKNEISNVDNLLLNTKPNIFGISKLGDNIDESIDIIKDIYNAKHLIRLGACFMHFDNTILEDEFDEEIRKKLYDFEISNPFETCFAFAYLLTINSDIIWLLNPCNTLLKVAAEKLPWAKDYNIARESNEKEREMIEEKINNLDLDNLSDIENEILQDNDDLYKLKYNDSSMWEDYHNADKKDLLKINFPQFCYNFNEIIPPRIYEINVNKKHDKYLASNFDKEQLRMLNEVYYLLEASGDKNSFDNNEDDDEDDNRKYIDKIDELNKNNTNKNIKISVLKDRINNLQNALNALKKEFKKYKSENNIDKGEINRLRETIFALQNKSDDEEINKNTKIEIPYYSLKKAVVVGGSDTWINKMKEVLNNVSFLSSKQKLNLDVIKNVEMIWIQIIGLSHSDFYAITNYSKAHHIPIYYFSYSNIEKCLLQFVENNKTSNFISTSESIE